MSSSSVLARVGLVSVVVVILAINTLSALLPAADFRKTPVSGPPLYQAAALPDLAERTAAPATDARPKPARRSSTAVALLALPQKVADSSTTGLAPLPPPLVAEAESPPKPEKRAAAPKRAKKVRTQPSGDGGIVRPGPPIYTREVQMSVY